MLMSAVCFCRLTDNLPCSTKFTLKDNEEQHEHGYRLGSIINDKVLYLLHSLAVHSYLPNSFTSTRVSGSGNGRACGWSFHAEVISVTWRCRMVTGRIFGLWNWSALIATEDSSVGDTGQPDGYPACNFDLSLVDLEGFFSCSRRFPLWETLPHLKES